MIAVALTFGIVACWGIVGYALTSFLLPRRAALSNLLLAPSLGMGTLELAAHIGLRCGSPVGPIAHAIVFTALLLALAVLLVRRPPIPLRQAWPFGLILLVAVPLTAWPMFRWGGDWIANANEDMSNYCLAGTGYREHGFLSLPIEEYLSGQNLTHGVWFLYSDHVGHRPGCEMSLAMTSEIASLPVPMIFMPVIIASHLALICATGFLTCRLAEGRKVALISCGLMAISPLSTYGVAQQLIAQVGGLALLVVTTGLFFRPARRLPAVGYLKRGMLGGILGASLVLHYVESLPFLVVGFGLHATIGFARGQRDLKQLALVAIAAIPAAALLGGFLFDTANFLLLQMEFGQRTNPIHLTVFPQYLNGEGFARLWGFETVYQPVSVRPNSSWPFHRLVVLGGLCVLLSLAAGIALAWRRRPIGVMSLVILGVAVMLYRSSHAFALFKLAMYAQPFILGTVALGWVRMNPGRWKQAGFLCLLTLVPLQLTTQYNYVSRSGGLPDSGGSLPGATRERLLTQFQDAFETPGAKRFVVPINDRVAAKLAASCSHGVTLCYPCTELCPILRGGNPGPNGPFSTPSGDPKATDAIRRIFTRTNGSDLIALHNGTGDSTAQLLSYAPEWLDQPEPGDCLLELPLRHTPLNRFHRTPSSDSICSVVPLSNVSNYLLWRQSTRSQFFSFNYDEDTSGLYQMQPDVAFPKGTMAASGRYLTFQVLNPSPKVRVMLTGTASYLPNRHDLPPVEVVGDRRVKLPLVGMGAARVMSEPISLQSLGTSKYLVLDLGRMGALPNPSLPAVYRDPRVISLYLRDVSVLSEREYSSLVPPECVRAFPADLAQRQLEFSGCWEDGSVDKQSWFRLSQPEAHAPLVVRGRLPTTGSGTSVQNQLLVKWNGTEIGRKTIQSSEFEFRVPVPPGVGPGKLELEFSDAGRVSAQLTFVGFER